MYGNFDIIEQNTVVYNDCKRSLAVMQNELNKVLTELSEKRKNYSAFEKSVADKQIYDLNTRRELLKGEISELKKTARKAYNVAEDLIFKGVAARYSDVYDTLLSNLYGFKAKILIMAPGDEYFEDSCVLDSVVITHDKHQHRKILRMIQFGIKNLEDEKVVKPVVCEVCAYNRKLPAGEIYDGKEYLNVKKQKF